VFGSVWLGIPVQRAFAGLSFSRERYRNVGVFEHRRQPLATWPVFLRRLRRHINFAARIVGAALGVGILGYHFLAGFAWLDALVDASMILSGMGPVNPLQNTAGKLFASFYALFSGVVFISTAGIVLAPIVHRFLHKFHLDSDAN
jgi:hypothetical protein